ncbi:ImmA/IrrE family metallo-endopeptidase [Enterococcus olivae]
MQRLKNKLKELGIELEFLSMEHSGYYVPDLKKVFVNESLDEEYMKFVSLHELKHVLDHADYIALYDTFIHHSKMETEAEFYVIDTIIEENNGQYNYSQLIEEFDIGIGYDVRFSQ